MADSVFRNVEMVPPIEVFQLTKLCNECQHPEKVDLGAGAYRTEEGKPWVLPVVMAAEMQMANDKTLNHEYLPVTGLIDFCDAAVKVMLGSNHRAITENKVAAFQALGGTGALRIGAAFLNDVLKFKTVYVSAPTWGNHKTVFKRAGFSDIREYRYWDADARDLNINGMLEDLAAAPENAVVILHGIAHNPTGIDPTREQWESIYNVCKERKVFVFLDIAYQGFASGNLDEDGWAVRYFAEKDLDMFVAQSFSKNFGLYNERVGALHIISKDGKKLPEIRSEMAWVIRTMYSNPSNHGARVVATVLNNKAYFEDWKGQLSSMATRIKKMRQELVENLKKLGTPGTWDHITKQIGMFSFSGLNAKQVEYCKSKYIFFLNSGRISLCGLNSKNVGYVAKCIDEAVRTHPKSEVVSFASLAKKKLQDTLNVIATDVTIDGVMTEDNHEQDGEVRMSVRKSESDNLNFLKIKLKGSISDLSTPEFKTSVDHEVMETTSENKANPSITESKYTSTSHFNLLGENFSMDTQPGTFRSTVRTFSSRGAQTTGRGDEEKDVKPKSIPARFQGTMVTPVFFDGLMMTPEKLETLMKDAMSRNENLTIPVEFKGGMITAAFKSMAESFVANESSKTRVEDGGETQRVNVKFQGRLMGILDSQMCQDGIPVVFNGNMSQK